MTGQTIAAMQQVTKSFVVGHGREGNEILLRAVDSVSFDIRSGETLSLVGESGSGKSTIGRLLVGLIKPTEGRIDLFDRDIGGPKSRSALDQVRQRFQFVFQDPFGSLNPRMRVGDAIAEPLEILGGETARTRRERVAEMLSIVGLPADCAERYPHEFSGGQRQRIGIARALILRPELVICDEPVSGLDVSLQAQVVNLLLDLQEKFGLSYLFISHDLAVVRCVSTRVAVLYAGAIVELADRADLYNAPQHPYTQALIAAVPQPMPGRQHSKAIPGELPSRLNKLSGCPFRTRCPHAMSRCAESVPALREVAPRHFTACHLHAIDNSSTKPSPTSPTTTREEYDDGYA